MKADIHIHTIGSKNVFDNKWARLIGVMDCYSDPDTVYKIAKKRGMDLIAITDHNTIEEAKKLAEKHPDVIVGAEYMVKASDHGHIVDVIVLDLEDKIHEEFMKLRKESLEKFTSLAKHEKKPYFLCHIGWLVNPDTELTPPLVDEWISKFDVIEIINGTRQRENEFAQIVAQVNGKGGVGGSDSHSELGVGLTWTEADVSTKEDFLKAIAKGEGTAYGEGGSHKKLKKDALLLSRRYVRHECKKLREKGFTQALKDLWREDYKRYGAVTALAPFLWVMPDIEVRYHQRHQEKLMLKAEKEYIEYKISKFEKGNPLVTLLKKWLSLEMGNDSRMINPNNYYIKETKFDKMMDKLFGYEISDD